MNIVTAYTLVALGLLLYVLTGWHWFMEIGGIYAVILLFKLMYKHIQDTVEMYQTLTEAHIESHR